MIEAQVSEFFKFLFGRLVPTTDGSIDLMLKRDLHYGGWFDETTGAPVTGHGAVPVKLHSPEVTWPGYPAECAQPTLHICLNTTDLKGRRTENIRACNVICLDLDREIERAEVRAIQEKYDVGLIVESSPRKYHFYWRVSNSIPLDRWAKYQLAFASRFDGDKALRMVTAMIRVPGFERITKKGVKFTPKIIYRADISRLKPLDEGELIRKFPWIASEIAKGEKALEKERAEMSRIAREIWKKSQSKYGGSQGNLSITPDAGRNIQLYWTVKDRVINSSDSEGEAYCFGAEVNRAFGNPLRADEAYRCVKSAWIRGSKIRETREKRELSLLEDLPVQQVNGHAATNGVEIQDSCKVPAKPAEAKKKKRNAPIQIEIPPDFRRVATALAVKLWAKNRILAKRRFIESIKAKNYQAFADWFVSEWSEVGNINKDGPAALLQGFSKWNTPVSYATPTPEKLFLGVVVTFCSELYKLHVKRLEERGKALPKRPSHAVFNALAAAAWQTVILNAATPRQSSDIVVFQNGVFDLAGKRFTSDPGAPAKYSHAIWASFDERTAAEYENVLETSRSEGLSAPESVKMMLSRCCPRFYSYLENWFPGDMLTAVSILRFFGYCCTTDHSQHKFAFFYGPTRAGKGSLCRILCGIVGDNNYASMDYSVLEGGFSFSGMHNRLVVSIEEVEASQKEHNKRMGVIKKLTGGERVTFERKYQHAFEDYAIGKLVLQSNEALSYQDKGNAIRARMLVYGFEQTFEDNPGPDPAVVILGNSSNSEAPAIATLAALFWADARLKSNPFKVEGSRALKVGAEQVTQGINIISTVLRKYFVSCPNHAVEIDVFHKTILFAAESKGVTLPEAMPGKIGQLNIMIEKELPFAKYSHKSGPKKAKRGFNHVKFLTEQYLKDFPDAETLFENL